MIVLKAILRIGIVNYMLERKQNVVAIRKHGFAVKRRHSTEAMNSLVASRTIINSSIRGWIIFLHLPILLTS